MDDDLDATLAAIGWNRATLARRLGVDTDTVSRWAIQKRSDPRILPWLRGYVAYSAKHPTPPDWVPRPVGRPPNPG